MLVEIGHFALILALVVAAVQGIAPLVGASSGSRALMDLCRPSAILQLVLVSLAFFIFVNAHIVSDFSVRNVYENSTRALPLLYKITGSWGSHEGSMLLWVFILALYGGLVAIFGKSIPPTLRARALGIQGLLSCGTLAFVIVTSDPFTRLFPVPLAGHGLNPLLQDPGLAFHPPLLYSGYVGFSVTYSFAVAALLEGRVGAAWAHSVRPWTLLAWCGLTAGIALGSWWAYYVLGWGGWWEWDPVENASFMPWLLGTALLHSLSAVEKRESLVRWALLLAILTFGMSLVGTFLVRSGILTSVHAFALSPTRGIFILFLIAAVVGGALLLYAFRAPLLDAGKPFAAVSREGAFVLNNVVLSAGMATVFLGTFYPLFAQLASGVKLSVGAPYFDRTFVPILIPGIIAMALGPSLAWRHGNLGRSARRFVPAFFAAILGAFVVRLLFPAASWAALGGIALALWAMFGVVVELLDQAGLFRRRTGDAWRRLRHLPRGTWGYSIAHFGVGMLVAGVVVSTAWRSERIVSVHPGDSVKIAGFTLDFTGVSPVKGPDYEAERARIRVERPDGASYMLYPELRHYPVSGMQLSHTAIHTNGLADLYLALGPAAKKGNLVLRAFYNPLVPWIWFGAAFAAFGGLVSLADRRLRLATKAASAPLAAQRAKPS